MGSAYEATLFHAAALVMFFAALQVSELIVSSRRDLSCWALALSDVLLMVDSVQLGLGNQNLIKPVRGTLWSSAMTRDIV